jgi:hypothetical protein
MAKGELALWSKQHKKFDSVNVRMNLHTYIHMNPKIALRYNFSIRNENIEPALLTYKKNMLTCCINHFTSNGTDHIYMPSFKVDTIS